MTAPTFGGGEASVWEPSDRDIARSRLTRLMRRESIEDLAALQQRAVGDPEWWWRTVVDAHVP